MKKYKKIILRTLVIFFSVLFVWILAHRFDVKASPDLFGMDDIPGASFEKSNGFYFLWALSEPPEVDVTSDKIIEKYRRLFDPQYDNTKYNKEFDNNKYRGMFSKYLKKLERIDVQYYGRIDDNSKNWCNEVLTKRKYLASLDPDIQVLYDRFRLMIDSEVFEDFISVKFDAYLPNLIAWLHAAKLYTAVNVLHALDGDWERGVNNLLDMVDFGKRAVKGSRFLIINLVSKAMLAISIDAIADLMNQKECPNSVYEMVLTRTPSLKYEEIGTGQSLICEAVGFTYDFIERPFQLSTIKEGKYNSFECFLLSIFLQKNRSKNFVDSFIKKFIKIEQTLPHQWTRDMLKIAPIKQGMFWWLWNPAGKILLVDYKLNLIPYNDENERPWLGSVIFKTYTRQTIYDMLRISAELHLKYEPGKPVQEILKGLESYKVPDPCSGGPYRWNDEKQSLYSIGIDREDNGGIPQPYKQIEGVDYTMPVILYVK